MTISNDIQWFQMFSFSFIELQNVPPPPQPPKPIFSLNPNRFDLPPGASFEMFIEGFVERYVYMNVNGCRFSSSVMIQIFFPIDLRLMRHWWNFSVPSLSRSGCSVTPSLVDKVEKNWLWGWMFLRISSVHSLNSPPSPFTSGLTRWAWMNTHLKDLNVFYWYY